jgi:hypothetical protein
VVTEEFPMPTTNLQNYEGYSGLLRFTDGHLVRARSVHVDTDDRREVIYDVVDVLDVGPSKWSGTKGGTTATASLDEVDNFEVEKTA